MARGPKKHLKRLNAPKHWMLSKLGGDWAPRPSTGPHKLRECLPLSLILRNRLKYALTRRESLMVVMRRHVEVDGKVRTDLNYPAGFMDVVKIDATGEKFRLLYDVKGRFVLKTISEAESSYKLCRVVKVDKAKKSSIGRNPFITRKTADVEGKKGQTVNASGQRAVIPYLVTDDARTIRFADPIIRVGDTVKIDIATGKVVGHIKFDVHRLAMITKGHNVGRVGVIQSREKHPGGFDIVHLKDAQNHEFTTRASNVFIIGEEADPKKAWISLPRGKGVSSSILEEYSKRVLKINPDKAAAEKKESKQ